MRKLLVLLLFAAPLLARDGTYSTTVTEEARYTRQMNKVNRETCVAEGLAVGCTQNQARDAYCQLQGGTNAPCSGSTAVKVFTDTNDFIDRFALKDYLALVKAEQDREDQATWAAWLAAATQAQKDALCVSINLVAGCLP